MGTAQKWADIVDGAHDVNPVSAVQTGHPVRRIDPDDLEPRIRFALPDPRPDLIDEITHGVAVGGAVQVAEKRDRARGARRVGFDRELAQIDAERHDDNRSPGAEGEQSVPVDPGDHDGGVKLPGTAGFEGRDALSLDSLDVARNPRGIGGGPFIAKGEAVGHAQDFHGDRKGAGIGRHPHKMGVAGIEGRFPGQLGRPPGKRSRLVVVNLQRKSGCCQPQRHVETGPVPGQVDGIDGQIRKPGFEIPGEFCFAGMLDQRQDVDGFHARR